MKFDKKKDAVETTTLSIIEKKIKSIENTLKVPANLENAAVRNSLHTIFQEIDELLASISSEQSLVFNDRIERLRNIVFPYEITTAISSAAIEADEPRLSNLSISPSASQTFQLENYEDWTTEFEFLPGKTTVDKTS